MQLLLVLAILPVIYVVAWLVSPLLVALHAIVTVAERLHMHIGPWAGTGFLVVVVVAVAAGATARKFLLFGLLPVTVGIVLLARA